MQNLNLALFGAIAGGFAPDPQRLSVAIFASEAGPWLAAALMFVAGFRRPRAAPYLLISLAVAVATAMLAKDIAAALNSPRPFMIGLSPSHVSHGERGGLPSTHASVMFAVAAMLLLHPGLRMTGAGVAALAAVTAWARIYLGIHFPFDIAAGLVFGSVVAGTVCLALATVEGHRGVRSERRATHPLTCALMHGNASRYAVLLCAVAALSIGLAMPDALAAQLVRDGGPLETVTVLLYLVAIAGVLATQRDTLNMADKTALGILLLALAGHEADILQLSTVGTFAVAVPLAISAAWLVLQYGASLRRLRLRPRWRTPAATVMMFLAVAMLAGILDLTPDALGSLGLQNRLPPVLWQAVLNLEEMLEMLLPVLAMLALVQLWLEHRNGPAASPASAGYTR